MTPLQFIQLREPTLATAQAARIADLIALCTQLTSAAFFGINYNYAIALRALHYLIIEQRMGAAGAIASESEGSMSRSYQSSGASQGSSDLNSTSYGQELLTLGRAGGAGMPVNFAVKC